MPGVRQIIVIRRVEQPRDENVSRELDWICQSLGLECEKDALESDVFKAIVRAMYNGHGISSGEIKSGREVSQAAITYHLNHLLGTGLVVKQGRQYYLRASTLSRAIDELEEDMQRTIARMREIAKRIDGRFIRE